MNIWTILTLSLLLISCPVKKATSQTGQPMKAFSLSDVRLTYGPFYNAQETDLRYILAMDPDRLLAPFIIEAGLPTNKPPYGNWENTGLNGHVGGHYLSALSLMVASTGDAEVKKRLDYMIDQLDKCQQQDPDGYVGGIPGGKAMWQEIKAGKIDAHNFGLNGKWVPLYNIHKLFAGLRDAYQVGGNPKAKVMFLKLCDWFATLTQSLSDEQFQDMLRSEHGGMNEVFADAFEMTGEKKYLGLSRKLSHQFILNPLLAKQDQLTGLHANTQIPKVIGFKKIADLSADTSWRAAADFFWKTVTDNRSVSIGGNSVREHFHPADNFSSMIESNQGPETCNTYNMLRLAKSLFLTNPDARYIDYYERATYNHILSSQHPKGGFVYFTPMRPQHYRVYSSVQESFWCCVGSGIENHAKYGELIYTHNDNDLYVNLFIPSTLDWKAKGLSVEQRTEFPFEEKSTLTLKLNNGRRRFAVYLRYPKWVQSGKLVVTVNGKNQVVGVTPGSYVRIDRMWKNGDVISISVPMHTEAEYLPDHSSWASFVHGPIVLASPTDTTDLKGLIADDSRMGHVAEGRHYPVNTTPIVVKTDKGALPELTPVAGKPLTFSLAGMTGETKSKNLELVPFFKVHDTRYIIYWPIASKQEAEKTMELLKQQEQEKLDEMKRLVDHVVVGEQQPEVEHQFKGSTESGSTNGKTWRSSSHWFSYEFQNKESNGKIIRLIYEGAPNPAKFDLVVNDQVVKTIEHTNKQSDQFYTEDLVLPDGLLTLDRLTIKLVAHPGSTTGRISQIMLLQSN